MKLKKEDRELAKFVFGAQFPRKIDSFGIEIEVNTICKQSKHAIIKYQHPLLRIDAVSIRLRADLFSCGLGPASNGSKS